MLFVYHVGYILVEKDAQLPSRAYCTVRIISLKRFLG